MENIKNGTSQPLPVPELRSPICFMQAVFAMRSPHTRHADGVQRIGLRCSEWNGASKPPIRPALNFQFSELTSVEGIGQACGGGCAAPSANGARTTSRPAPPRTSKRPPSALELIRSADRAEEAPCSWA